LIEAARRYDPARGTRFITYAVWWIRKAILKALARQASLFRVPEYRIRKVKRLREAEATLSRRMGREPAKAEISEYLKRSVSEIDAILLTRPRAVSLDESTGPEGSPIGDLLADPTSLSPEEKLLRGEARHLVRDALRTLTQKERMIIRKRMGIPDRRPMTLKEIGVSLGLSRERVRQIEEQAMNRLRRYFVTRSLPPRMRTSLRLLRLSTMSGLEERRRPKRRSRRAAGVPADIAPMQTAKPVPQGFTQPPVPPLDH
jgi:RNA polymerase primary sigma factor